MAATPPKPSSKIVVPKKLTWRKEVLAFIVQAFIRLFTLTWRYELHDPHGFLKHEKKRPVIYCLWHNRLAVAPGLFQIYKKRFGGETNIAVLVSASNDGAFLTRILNYFGMVGVRGSSSKRGGQALLELSKLIAKGYDIGITPDGPRGPCYKISPGIITLAQTTGSPILPFSTKVRWKKCWKSWDRFQVPLPFAKIEVHAEKLLHVPKDISDEQSEALLQSLGETMNSITVD